MKINLNIANKNCLLQVDNDRWYRFLMEKYRKFVIRDDSKPDMNLKIVIRSKRAKITHSFDGAKRGYILFFPDNLRRFKRFNTYFKFFFSNLLLLQNEGFLLHASALKINKESYIFCGKQGSGKSTILKLAPEYDPLNDDAAIIKTFKGKFLIQSSPFYEKNRIKKLNVLLPINKVFFLQKAKKNQLYQPKAAQKLRRLISNVYIKKESKEINQLIYTNLNSLCYNMVKYVPMYVMAFKKDKSFINMILKK